jgi:2-polyprenyl-3-methyl-5-hydroxy-6-metoxy-1,4-benzoquinol methylase
MPPSIFQLGYYWDAKIFLVSVRLDVYTHLVEGPRTAQEIAEKIGADATMLGRLLDALVTIGVLNVDPLDAAMPPPRRVRYANTQATAEFLVKTSPFYIGDLMWLQDEEWGHWGRLEETIRSGKPPVEGHLFMNRPDVAERVLGVLHRMAKRTAPDLARRIDLSTCQTFLDVGGGSGAYSIAFCLQNPALRATLFDLPTTLAVTQKHLKSERMDDRVSLVAGDFNRDAMPGIYDVVFLSDVLHYQTDEENGALIAKLHGAVRPGGRIIVKDMFIGDHAAHPGWNAIFSIHMLIYAEKGQCFRSAAARSWLSAAGFTEITEMERNTVFTAVRPHVGG